MLTPQKSHQGFCRGFLFCFNFLSFFFLGPHLWHIEVPRPGVESELQPTPQPQQRQTQAASATYTTAHGNTKSLTHWARPGIEPASSWILVGFVTAEPWQELPIRIFWGNWQTDFLKCTWEHTGPRIKTFWRERSKWGDHPDQLLRSIRELQYFWQWDIRAGIDNRPFEQT